MRRKWGWHNNSVNGQNQVRQKARGELPFPKSNSEIKKYVRANLPGSETIGTGADQKGRSARGQKKRFGVDYMP